MDLFGFSSAAGAWLAPTLAVAVLGLGATAILLLDHLRLERHAGTVEADLAWARAELRRLAERSERDRAVVEAMPDLVVWRDAAGRVSWTNHAFAELAQSGSHALIGSTMLPIPKAARPPQEFGNGLRLAEECHSGPLGDRWIAWIDVPVRNGSIRFGRDVTDHVHRQRQLEAQLFCQSRLDHRGSPRTDACSQVAEFCCHTAVVEV